MLHGFDWHTLVWLRGDGHQEWLAVTGLEPPGQHEADTNRRSLTEAMYREGYSKSLVDGSRQQIVHLCISIRAAVSTRARVTSVTMGTQRLSTLVRAAPHLVQ